MTRPAIKAQLAHRRAIHAEATAAAARRVKTQQGSPPQRVAAGTKG